MARRALPMFLLLAVAGGCHKREAAAPQPEPAATPAAAPAAKVATDHAGKPAPKAGFVDLASGKPVGFDAFRGKPVLVNLWATWCGPCVKELPTLARLAQAAPGGLQVAAISEDMEGAKVVPPFLRAHGPGLHPYHDASNGLLTAFGEASLPVSILFDAQGRELWRVHGDLDWTGAQAKALLAQAGA